MTDENEGRISGEMTEVSTIIAMRRQQLEVASKIIESFNVMLEKVTAVIEPMQLPPNFPR